MTSGTADIASQGGAEPARSGTAALTDADIETYRAGRVTLAELGSRLGISKQAVAKALKRRGVTRSDKAAPGTADIPTLGTAAPTDSPSCVSAGATDLRIELVEVEPGRLQDLIPNLARNACAALLVRLAAAAASPEQMAPSALKASATALSSLLDDAERLGLIEADDDAGALPELTVKVMSRADAEVLRASLEGDDDPDLVDNPEGPEDMAPVPAAAPSIDDAPADLPAHESSRDANVVLRDRMAIILRRHGAQGLRAVAVALGLPRSGSSDHLIRSICAHAEQDADARAALISELDRLDAA